MTAEEKGLLGAKYYATHPLYPLEKTLADINMDGVNQWGKTSDMTIVGSATRRSTTCWRVLASQGGRTLGPDPEPEKGFFYRSDHFEFAKQGVPALYTDAGTEYIGKDPTYGQKKRDEYTENDYHKVSDEVKPDWDLSGAVEDLRRSSRWAIGSRRRNGGRSGSRARSSRRSGTRCSREISPSNGRSAGAGTGCSYERPRDALTSRGRFQFSNRCQLPATSLRALGTRAIADQLDVCHTPIRRSDYALDLCSCRAEVHEETEGQSCSTQTIQELIRSRRVDNAGSLRLDG